MAMTVPEFSRPCNVQPGSGRAGSCGKGFKAASKLHVAAAICPRPPSMVAGEVQGLLFLGTEGGDSPFLELCYGTSSAPRLGLVADLDSLAPIHSAFAFQDPPGAASPQVQLPC